MGFRVWGLGLRIGVLRFKVYGGLGRVRASGLGGFCWAFWALGLRVFGSRASGFQGTLGLRVLFSWLRSFQGPVQAIPSRKP